MQFLEPIEKNLNKEKRAFRHDIKKVYTTQTDPPLGITYLTDSDDKYSVFITTYFSSDSGPALVKRILKDIPGKVESGTIKNFENFNHYFRKYTIEHYMTGKNAQNFPCRITKNNKKYFFKIMGKKDDAYSQKKPIFSFIGKAKRSRLNEEYIKKIAGLFEAEIDSLFSGVNVSESKAKEFLSSNDIFLRSYVLDYSKVDENFLFSTGSVYKIKKDDLEAGFRIEKDIRNKIFIMEAKGNNSDDLLEFFQKYENILVKTAGLKFKKNI